MGLDVKRLLETVLPMQRACGADVPPAENPGVQLGVAMGVAATRGRDTHGDAELYAWILRRRHVRAAGSLHRQYRLEQAFDVKTHGRRRHQAEFRQHGVAPADRSNAVENMSKAKLLSALSSLA